MADTTLAKTILEMMRTELAVEAHEGLPHQREFDR
jgi:hypothetical protein